MHLFCSDHTFNSSEESVHIVPVDVWKKKKETPLMSWSNAPMVVCLFKKTMKIPSSHGEFIILGFVWTHYKSTISEPNMILTHQISIQPMLRRSNWWRTPSVTWATTWFWLRFCQWLVFPSQRQNTCSNFGWKTGYLWEDILRHRFWHRG